MVMIMIKWTTNDFMNINDNEILRSSDLVTVVFMSYYEYETTLNMKLVIHFKSNIYVYAGTCVYSYIS